MKTYQLAMGGGIDTPAASHASIAAKAAPTGDFGLFRRSAFRRDKVWRCVGGPRSFS